MVRLDLVIFDLFCLDLVHLGFARPDLAHLDFVRSDLDLDLVRLDLVLLDLSRYLDLVRYLDFFDLFCLDLAHLDFVRFKSRDLYFVSHNGIFRKIKLTAVQSGIR